MTGIFVQSLMRKKPVLILIEREWKLLESDYSITISQESFE